MSQVRRYSESGLRALVESFNTPMLVIRDGRLWVVNQACLELLRQERPQVEGRYFWEFTAPKAHTRLEFVYRRHEAESLLPTSRLLVNLPDGRVQEVMNQSQPVELEEGGFAQLAVCMPLGEGPTQPELAERLAALSPALVTARSEEAVRREAVAGLATAGLTARFLRRVGDQLVTLDGLAPPPEQELGWEALAESRPAFGGTHLVGRGRVYLPLGTGQPELLWLEGAGVGPSHGSLLVLFARVVGAALVDAGLLADVERGRWEMGAVAEVARLVAWPQPPTPEDFLARLSSLLGAEAAALYTPDSEGALTLSAHMGLETRMREALQAPLRGGVVEAAMSSPGPFASSEEQSRLLRSMSGERFGHGAAVRTSQGGRLRGVLLVLRPPPRPFVEADLRLLATLAELLGALLEQHRLRAEPPRQLADTRLLQDLARSTATALGTTGVLNVAADVFVRLLDVTSCLIFLYDKQSQGLRYAAASLQYESLNGLELSLDGDSVAARVARERRPLALENSQAAGREDRELLRLCGAQAVLGLPLAFRDDLIGVVLACESRRPRTFSPAQVDMAVATCAQIALALDNARLYESLLGSYAELAATRAEMVRRERLAALGELSAAVAHEVRNPLGVIFNAVSALRRMLHPEGDSALLLDILLQESDRLNRLVSNLLDYTRPREPVLQPEELRPVLEDAFEAARAQYPEGPLPFILFDLEPNLPRVPMDRQLLGRALLNVALNALQAMPHGGEVRVRARREARGGREQLRIELADQGPGIPEELLQRVFEPFFTTKAQGTGLGLAVVKRILELHRGSVSVESTPGRGATFSFLLPLSTTAVSLP